jgi:hypothetical protein
MFLPGCAKIGTVSIFSPGVAMKKKIIRAVIVLAVVGACFFMLWPLSFTDLIREDMDLHVRIEEFENEDGMPEPTVSEYTLSPGSEEHAAVREILDRYSYHRTFRSFWSGASINGSSWLSLYSGGNGITLGGTPEVIVGAHVYQVGYFGFGYDKAQNMMAEIRAVLENE